MRGSRRAMQHKPKIKQSKKRPRGHSHDHLETDVVAHVGSHTRSWTKHDIGSVKFKGRQHDSVVAFTQGNDLAMAGSAGTGKTFVACYLGLRELTAGNVKQVVIVRSAVQVRDQGFLPGSLEEKMQDYEMAYRGLFTELLPQKPNSYDDMKQEGLVTFLSTSMLRGLTIRDAVLIIDEAQNMDFEEIDTIMTRVGTGTRVIVCGDTRQNDLKRKRGSGSGMAYMLEVLKTIQNIEVVTYTPADCIRSGFCRAWLQAVDDMPHAHS